MTDNDIRANAVREAQAYIERISWKGLVPLSRVLADLATVAQRMEDGMTARGSSRPTTSPLPIERPHWSPGRITLRAGCTAYEDLERERDALAAEVDRLQLVHAGQARLALSAIFLADVDDDEGTQAFVDEWKRHHAAQALRDAAERWDWTEVPGGAPPVDRWLRAEADRLAPKAPDHNEQEPR